MIFKDCKLKDVSKLKGIVELMASSFNNQDAHGDIIAPGAFAKTIQEHGPEGSGRIKHLWMHWFDEILGKPLEMEETNDGLRVVSKISNTQLGRDALMLYADGVLNEHSVGIDVLRRDDEDNRIIKEVRLWEYSTVTWGANPKTPTISVKQLCGQDEHAIIPTSLEVQVAYARKALHSNISDSLGHQIESWLHKVEDHAPTDGVPHDDASQLEQLLVQSQLALMNSKIQNHA